MTETPTAGTTGPRLGIFTRLLEDAPADRRYRFALEQIAAAERFGLRSAWVAQHHFSAAEGGLPSDRKSTRLNSSHVASSYAVFCLKTKTHSRRMASPRTRSARTPPRSTNWAT